jgi:cellulose synthase/poly-beta-1,6-N-acetylglucosamine synthase-like glycosyltransferase
MHGLILLFLDGMILTLIVLHGLSRNYDDSDRGSGNVVDLPPPLRPSYKRCGTFIGVSFLASVALVGLRSPNVAATYRSLVATLMGTVIHDPAAVQAYAKALPPVFQLNFVVFGIAFAVAFRASLARRLVTLANVALGMAVSAVADALFGVFAMESHIPLGPRPILNLLLQYSVAGAMALRLSFISFQLPRKTPFPLRRGFDWRGDIVLVTTLLFATGVTITLGVYLTRLFGNSPLVTTLVVVASPVYVFIITDTCLLILMALTRRRPNPGPVTPPIEVIIPAFNEEVVISRLLESLDVSAGRYGGPVRVILCDDGSTDDTIKIAQEVMGAYRYATGEIIAGRHGGKSAALNQALGHCEADVVFRFDADTEAHPDTFRYAVPHFLADPTVGLVGGLTVPKEPYTTWIDRMRLFEVVVTFGFARLSSQMVDGNACIPGFFTGFRREAALELGGYGEDIEFTFDVTRIGYRAVIDTRVITYEDVPNTHRQLRIQRTRWNRGGTMAFARNAPIATGLAGPRVWFFGTRSGMGRALNPMNLSLITYLVAQSIFAPTARVNLLHTLAVVILRWLPAIPMIVAYTVWRGKAKELVWLPVMWVFAMLRRWYALEAYLSFNPRPVVTPSLAEALRPSPAEAEVAAVPETSGAAR